MIGLILAIGVIVLLFFCVGKYKENIVKLEMVFKIGIFSVLVGLLGYIFSYFDNIGYVISSFAIVILIMCCILKLYLILFKTIKGKSTKIGLLALFLSLIFQALILNYEALMLEVKYIEIIILARNITVGVILACTSVKAYKVIFSKTNTMDMKDEVSNN